MATTPIFTTRATSTLPFDSLATSFAEAFSGYFVPIPADPAALAARVRLEHIDLSASFLAVDAAGDTAGVTLVARRGDVSRIAGMGVMPACRGQGVGRFMLERALRDAAERNERRVTLEVIEQNDVALHLYQKLGFRVSRRLAGYEADVLTPVEGPVEPLRLSEFASLVARHGPADLPWQLAPVTLAAVTPPAAAYRLAAAAALVHATPDAVMLRALIVPVEQRRAGHARRLLQALAARFEGRRWLVPAITPQALADPFLLASGFRHSTLAQYEMHHDLPGVGEGR